MPTTTLLRTISGVDDIRAGVSSATLRRLLSIGSNWNQLRVGLRWCMQPGGAVIQGKRIFIGVCSGTAQPFNNGSAPTTHAVGWLSPLHSSYPLHGGTAPDTYYETGGFNRAVKRVGTTLTQSSAYVGTPSWWPATTDHRAIMQFVTITKGSPNFTVASWAHHGPTGVVHITKEVFIEYVVLPSPTRSSYQSASSTVPVNEANDGALDTVNVAFEGSNNMEVCDLAVVRFS